MSRSRPEIPEPHRMLPGAAASPAATTHLAPRQLQEMPKDELRALAEEYGLDPARYPTPQHLVAAIHERRQLIANLDRDAMLDVIVWGRRPVPLNASKEQLAMEIARIKGMNFAGLSQRGLMTMARLRGVDVDEHDDVPALIRKLRRKESFFSRLNRKRRSLVASIVSQVVGDEPEVNDYQFLPPQQGLDPTSPSTAQPPPRSTSLKEDIEESGLFGGIAGRIKKSADSYINQKLDEVEARIDRKLDEIDRRLAEWRDKEIANRIRILKITLWASVIVALISLIYSFVKVYLGQLLGL